MKFEIRFVPSADEDLEYYEVREQRIILSAIGTFLEVDADVESRRRKRMRSDRLGRWELRVGDYRVFYEITAENVVRVLTVGHKTHNELFIRGRRADV